MTLEQQKALALANARMRAMQPVSQPQSQFFDVGQGNGDTSIPMPSSQDVTNLLPAAGGMLGGALGTPGGPVGMAGGATLGGAGGEAFKQLANRALGNQVPQSAIDAASNIGIEGAKQGAYNVGGQLLNGFLGYASKRLMQSALKPSKTLGIAGQDQAVQTMLDNGINVSKGGLDKLKGIYDDVNGQIKDLISNSDATVSQGEAVSKIRDSMVNFAKQVNPDADLAALKQVATEFMQHPEINGDAIPVQLAQQLKQGTYKQIAGKYGELSNASVEGQKAIARGLKEGIANAVPGVAALNAQDSQLINGIGALSNRLAVGGNSNPVGFANVATDSFHRLLAALADSSDFVKSAVARALSGAQPAAQIGVPIAGNAGNLLWGGQK